MLENLILLKPMRVQHTMTEFHENNSVIFHIDCHHSDMFILYIKIVILNEKLDNFIIYCKFKLKLAQNC